ncbi:MAG: hypothetical protein E5Y74_35635, partial [Mesorhizobium sp.]
VGGTAPPSVLPDISPTRGEIGSFSAPPAFATLVFGEPGVIPDLPTRGGDVRQDRGGRQGMPSFAR